MSMPTDAAEGPTLDRDERLGEAIEDYLELVETGQAPDPDEYANRYPDLKDDLRAALEGLAVVQGLVGESGHGAGGRLEAGRRVAGYRIVRELGRGGMGIVYEAVHVDLDRPVALKVLGMHAAPDSNGRRRFLNEAKTAASLHHTHIVPVFDVGQVGGLCYYAMQRIEGCGLDRVIKSMRKERSTAAGSTSGRPGLSLRWAVPPVPEAPSTVDLHRADESLGDMTRSWLAGAGGRRPMEKAPRDERPDEAPPFEPPRGSEYYRWVARAGSQAADALAHAHRRGVIHRDVKPSNLLVDARGTVWVADFGLARRTSDPSLTQTESLVGTPRYMSPEQAVQGPIDIRSDVYSLGATLYEMLTLRPPHDGKSTAELIAQIRDREPISPRRLDPRLPRDLETIVLKAMAKRPQDRYPSAQELSEDLQRFLATEPVKARRIGPVGRAWRFVRRHPSLTAVSTVAAASILATATVAYVRVVQERNKAVAARGELKRALILNLWRAAESARKTRVPDLRKTGLEQLREAVALEPGPEMITQLRDEAVQLLAVRDLEPRPPINVGPTRRVAFAGSEDRIATLSDDGSEISLWSLSTGERLRRFALAPAAGVAGEPRGGFGPGGRGRNPFQHFQQRMDASGDTLAVILPGGAGVRILDLARDGAATDLPMGDHHVATLALTPDGRRLLTAEDQRRGGQPGTPPRGPEERAVLLWDPTQPDAPIATLDLPEPRADGGFSRGFGARPIPVLIGVSSDGRTVATAVLFETAIALWSAEDGKPLGEIAADGPVSALAFSPDGTIAAASNGTVARWDARTRKPLPGLSLHQPFVKALRFSPDGTMLAVAGNFNGVEVWDPEANAPVASVPTSENVEEVAFSPGGASLVATVGKTARAWALVEPIGRTRLAAPETRPASHLAGLSFGPAGKLGATFWSGSSFGNPAGIAARLQCREGGLCTRENLHSLAIGFDPSGRLVVPEPEGLALYASARDDRPEQVVPWPEGFPDPPFGPPTDGPASRRGRPDAGADRDRDRNRPPAEPPVTFGGLTSADGRTLLLFRRFDLIVARFGADGAPPTLTIVRPASGSGFGFGPGGGGGPDRRGPRPAPDGSPGAPPSGGRPPGEGAGGGRGGGGGGPAGRGSGAARTLGNPFSHALSPRGDLLYMASPPAAEAGAWRIDGDVLREVPWRVAHRGVTHIAAAPSGRTVALARNDGSVTIASADDGTMISTIAARAEADPVQALAFSPSGELAIGYRSGLIRLWSTEPAASPRPIVALPRQPGDLRALSYSRDGRRLAVGGDDGADLWDLDQVRSRLAGIGLGW